MITTKQLLQQIILNQLSLVNKTVHDIKSDPDFYVKYIITEDQYNLWYEQSLSLLINDGNLDIKHAKRMLDHLDVAYGLLYKYEPKRVALPEYIDQLILEIQLAKKQKTKKN